MHYSLVFLLSFLLPVSAQAGVKIQQPVWYVELTCDGNSECYAASNGSYTGSFNGAKKFREERAAIKFFDSLTSKIKDKSPRLVQGWEFECIETTSANGPDC